MLVIFYSRELEQCHDCGKYRIRATNEQEKQEFLNRQQEEELSSRNDDNAQ